MRLKLFLLAGFILLTSCGPRQDEKDRGGPGGGGGPTSFSTGESEVVDQMGSQLKSADCGDKNWDTIRMYYELSGIYNRARDIKVFVGRGQNCVTVGETVAFVQESGPQAGDWDAKPTGVSNKVSRIEAMNTRDLLADPNRLAEAAEYMFMTIPEMTAYLNNQPFKSTVTFTYLGEGSASSGNSSPVLSQNEIVIEENGQLESSHCGPKKEGQKPLVWQNVFFPYSLNNIFDEIPNVKIYANRGGNCHKVSSTEPVGLAPADDETTTPLKAVAIEGLNRYVTKLEALTAESLYANQKKLEEVAAGMTLTVEDLKAYLDAKPEDTINLTYLDSGNGSGDGDSDSDSDSGNGSSTISDKLQVLAGLADQGIDVLTTNQKTQLSCSSEDIWMQVRLNHDLFFMFDKASGLTRFISTGIENCFQVDEEQTTQLFLQAVEDGDYVGKDNYFKVKKVQLLSVQRFLSNETLLKEVAEGMFIPEAQIVAMLNSDKSLQYLTITDLEPSEKMEPVQPGQSIKELSSPVHDGQVLKACEKANGSIKWSSLHVFDSDRFKEKIENKSLKAWLGDGDFNCVPIGSEVGFVFQKENPATGKKDWTDPKNHPVKIESVTVLDKETLLNVSWMQAKLAEDLGMSVEELLQYIESFNPDKKQINITRITWL